MSRNILCVVEFDNYPKDVVARAAWLARTHDCDLHLLLCDPVIDLLGDSYVYLFESQYIADSIRAVQAGALADLVELAEEAGVKVDSSIATERNVASVIRREADAREPKFVVKGTHYHTPLERASLSDVDWDLIRDLDYPLWFVKPVQWKDAPVIVAAVDPAHAHDKPAYLDRRIVERARDVAEKSGGTLQVIHTYQTLAELGARATWAMKPQKLPVDELNRQIREQHSRALKIFGETAKIPDDALHLLPGRASDILPSFALEKGASLVVMGALARSKLKQKIVGSTAARTLDHFHCDVLIAHTEQGA